MGAPRTSSCGVSPNRKRVASTVAKKVAGAKRRKALPAKSTVRARKSRASATPAVVNVNSVVAAWSAEEESPNWTRRMMTAARAKGARPMTHDVFAIAVHNNVKVLTCIKGRSRQAVWRDARVVAVRRLRATHRKAVLRKVLVPGVEEPAVLPSSIVVYDSLVYRKSAPGELKQSCSYLNVCHDWQCIPTGFFGKKKHSIVQCRRARRSKQGLGGLVDFRGRGVDLLTPTTGRYAPGGKANKKGSLVKVVPRCSVRRR